MVLESVCIQEFCPRSVTEDKSVGSRAVMVRRRKSLIVKSAGSARCDNNGLCSCNKYFLSLHVHKNGTCRLAVFVEDKLDSRREVNYGNASVENFVAKRTHYLHTGVILSRVHSLSRGSAAMGREHGSVGSLVKFNSEIVEPLNSLGSLGNESVKKLGLCREMSAAESVKEVDSRRIVRLISSLNTALSHHCISVTDTKLCNDHCLYARFVSLDSCGSTCAAAADDKHICLIIRSRKVYISSRYPALALKKCSQLCRNLIALVNAC